MGEDAGDPAPQTRPQSQRFSGRGRLALFVGLFLAVALFTLWPVLFHEGWPLTHEKLSWKFRTLVYAFHFSQGDLLPIWSSEDCFGLGTPLPFFYHKLYYAIAGLLYLVSGSIKLTTVVTVAGLLVAGCLGLYRCLQELSLSPTVAALVAALLPLQSYTIYDWLARGAMAEFTACMLIPWLLYSIVILLKRDRVSWHLFANLLLLILAHSVFGFYAGLVIGAALAVTFWRLRTDVALFSEARKVMLGAAAIGLFLAPWVLAYLRLSEYYSLSDLVSGDFHPVQQFKGLATSHGFYPRWWGSGGRADWRPELGTETLLFLMATGLGLGWGFWKQKAGLFGGSRSLPFLLAVLAASILLQHPASGPLYEFVPGLSFIQYPRRLIGFEQVLALLVIGWGLTRLPAGASPKLATLLAAAMLLWSISASRSVAYEPRRWYAAAKLEEVPAPGASLGVKGIGEYLPRIEVASVSEEDTELSRWERYEPTLIWLARRDHTIEADDPKIRCAMQAPGRSVFEAHVLEIRLRCPSPVTLVVTQNYSGLERVVIDEGDGWRRAEAWRTAKDPRIRLAVPPGDVRVRVELPRLWHVLLPPSAA